VRALILVGLTLVALGVLWSVGGTGPSREALASSDNGVSSQSANAILAAAKQAALSASSVHVTGSLVSGSTPIKLDLNIVSGKGGEGEMSENGLSFKLIAVGQSVYINASTAFWRHFGGSAAATLFKGRWLKASAAHSDFSSISALTNLKKLLSASLANQDQLTKGASSTVLGQPVIAVLDAAHHAALYVATSGQPYPLEIAKTGSDGGSITFDKWNQPFSITAPAGAISLSQLTSGK
jgi:hypothetical protein